MRTNQINAITKIICLSFLLLFALSLNAQDSLDVKSKFEPSDKMIQYINVTYRFKSQ